MSESLHELLKFIQIGARFDLKAVSIDHILGLTATDDGITRILEIPEIPTSLISLLADNNEIIIKQTALALINLSANNRGAEILVNLDIEKYVVPLQRPPKNVVETVLGHIFDRSSKIADPCCMILSNLTRHHHLLDTIIGFIDNSDKNLDELVDIFTKTRYNSNGANLDYLAPILANLSRNPAMRRLILDRNRCVIQRLLPFTTHADSVVRRQGVVATIKNCCFEINDHRWLLSDDVDILPRLLLPLAGGEAFDDDDNDKLPLDLQYLPETKRRESEAAIRCDLIEAIQQLCSQRVNREFIRDRNAYLILRELHKSESDRRVLLVCENLIDLLIRTEEEIGEDDLTTVEIPVDLQENFHKIDEEFLKND